MVEDEVDGNEWHDAFTRRPHRAVHHLVPTFLCQDLKHGHHTLTTTVCTRVNQRTVRDNYLSSLVLRQLTENV